MSLFALTPDASDIFTVWGFVVGVVGLVVGVGGFWIAIKQIRETKKVAEAGMKAAEAAREAANKTLAASKDAYERFVGAFASRLLSELEGAVRRKHWQVAYLRSGDLAELLASLPATRNAVLNRLVGTCVSGLRAASLDFSALDARNAAKLPKPLGARWFATLGLVQTRIDELRKPFRGSYDDQIGNSDAAGRTDEVGPRPPRQDEGGAGELGSDGR